MLNFESLIKYIGDSDKVHLIRLFGLAKDINHDNVCYDIPSLDKYEIICLGKILETILNTHILEKKW